MSDNELQSSIFHIIEKLESSLMTQSSINEAYDNFVNIVHSEMYSKLPHKVVTLYSSGYSKKKLRSKKPWWSEDLTLLWSEMCSAEKQWLKCKPNDKANFKHIYVQKRKLFDKGVQRAKRYFVYQAQVDLEASVNASSGSFWKDIGKIGLGNERLNKNSL